MPIVYEIYNTSDSKIYVGSTCQELKKRFSEHKCDAKSGQKSPLYRHMREIGIEKFQIREILTCSVADRFLKEREHIEKVEIDRRLNKGRPILSEAEYQTRKKEYDSRYYNRKKTDLDWVKKRNERVKMYYRKKKEKDNI